MNVSTALSVKELAQVRKNLDKILNELQLDAYVYEVEPHEGQWQLTVECATEDGWKTVKFSAKEEYLIRGADDAIIHETLMDSLREALSSCKLDQLKS